MDRHIKFVCIVDQTGKLLVGQGSNIPISSTDDNHKNTISSPYILSDFTKLDSRIDELVKLFLKNKNMYLFYHDYLLWIIENCTLHLKNSQNKNNSDISSIVENKVPTYFEISGYDNEDDVKLAITPINESKYRFLCIYFEPAYRIRNSFNGAKEAFENLLNNISTNL